MDFEWPAENIVGHLVAYLVRHLGKTTSALRCGSPLWRLMWHIVAITMPTKIWRHSAGRMEDEYMREGGGSLHMFRETLSRVPLYTSPTPRLLSSGSFLRKHQSLDSATTAYAQFTR